MNVSSYDQHYEFLQDQVRRLTAVVREYQKKYFPINDTLVKDAPLEPWMDDPSMLSPLLLEYDSSIKSLKEQVKQYKLEFDDLKEKSKTIVEENDRLHHELRVTIESQLNAIQQTDGVSAQAKLHLDQLQHKLKLENDENDRLDKLYKGVNQSYEHAKEELRQKSHQLVSLTTDLSMLQEDLNKARKYAEGLQSANQKLKFEHEHFLKTAHVQDSEMDELRKQNRRIQGDMKTLKMLNDELQAHNNKLEEQLKYLDKDAKQEITSEKSAETTIRKLRNEIVELDNRVVSHSKELGKLRTDKVDLEEQLTALQKKNFALEESEYQAILRVRDSVQLVENALLEREQAIVKEQQKSQEVTRLQEAINNLSQQAEEQKRKEVNNARQQSNKQIQQLIEDLHLHELENAENLAAIEKLRREKTSLEKELERVYEEGPTEVTKANKSIDELRRRVGKVELARDEALLQLDAIQNTSRRNKTRWESEKDSYVSDLNDSQKQIEGLKQQLNEIAESRIKLLEETTSLKKELQIQREENAGIEIHTSSKISSLQQSLEMKEREFAMRLRGTEDLNKQAMDELREMLTLQQKNASKWRDESRSLCQKFENTIGQLRQENNNLKRKNNILQQSANEMQDQYQELEKELRHTQDALDRIQHSYTDSEQRAGVASTQVQTLLNREKQLLNDRKSLNREVDKLRVDLSRTTKHQNMEQQWSTHLASLTRE